MKKDYILVGKEDLTGKELEEIRSRNIDFSDIP